MVNTRLNSALVAVLMLAACGGEQTTTTPVDEVPLLISHAGSAEILTLRVSTDVPYEPTVIVTRNGVPTAGVSIQWGVGVYPSFQTGANVSPATSVTGPDGKASTKWRLTSFVGDQKVVAKIAGDTSARIIVFAVLAVPGAPTHFEKYTGDDQVLPETDRKFGSVGVGLMDDFGHYIWEPKIKWTVVSGPVTMAAADDYKYFSPLVSRGVTWTGSGAGTAVVRAEAVGTGVTADFNLRVVPVLPPVAVRRGPPYLIRIRRASSNVSPGLFSVQNGRSVNLNDTIPAGASIIFGDESKVGHVDYTIAGLPAYPYGLVVPKFGEISVSFPTPGTYPYAITSSSSGKGTIVVQ